MTISPLAEWICERGHQHRVYLWNLQDTGFRPEMRLRLEITTEGREVITPRFAWEQVVLSGEQLRHAINGDAMLTAALLGAAQFFYTVHNEVVQQAGCLKSEVFWTELGTELIRCLAVALGHRNHYDIRRVDDPEPSPLGYRMQWNVNPTTEIIVERVRSWVHFKYQPENATQEAAQLTYQQQVLAPLDNEELTRRLWHQYQHGATAEEIAQQRDTAEAEQRAAVVADQFFREMFPTLNRSKPIGIESKAHPDMVYVVQSPSRVYVFQQNIDPVRPVTGFPLGWIYIGHLCIVHPGREPEGDQYISILLTLRDDEKAVWRETYQHGGAEMKTLVQEMGGLGGWTSSPPKPEYWPNCVEANSWLY